MNYFEEYRNKLLILFWACFCFGMTLSPALISLSLGAIALLGIAANPFKFFSKQQQILSFAFIAFYLSNAISMIYSDNQEEATRKLILKLPILLFPLLLNAFRSIQEKDKPWFYGILSYSAFLPAAVSTYNYLSHKAYFDELILQSKPLPVEFGYGIYHIQFSVFLACAIVIVGFRIKELLSARQKTLEFYALCLFTAFNFVFIHVLSARTGLLAMYIGLMILLLSSFPKLAAKQKLAIFATVLALPVLMYTLSGSLRNRIHNTLDDLQIVLNNKNPNDYSFAMRVEAWKNASDLILKKPFTGEGIGDAEACIQANYEANGTLLEPQNRKNPHFQLLETCVQSGLISGFLFLSIWGLSILLKFKQRHSLIAITSLLFIASCFESILERQASVACFAVFIGLCAAVTESMTPEQRPNG